MRLMGHGAEAVEPTLWYVVLGVAGLIAAVLLGVYVWRRRSHGRA